MTNYTTLPDALDAAQRMATSPEIAFSSKASRQIIATLANEVMRLNAENERLRKALADFLERYVSMVNSGDCGFWDPEKESFVIAARAALEPNHA